MTAAVTTVRRWLATPTGTAGNARPVWGALAVVFVISWVLVEIDGGNFLTVQNMRGMAVRSVALGLVTIGQTFVLVSGSIDLSVAYTISVTAILSGVVMDNNPNRMVLGVVVVLLIAAGIGLVNGSIVTGLRVHPFIATLGTSLILSGLINASFDNFAGRVPSAFQGLGYNQVGPVPVSVLFLVAVAVGAWYLLHRRRFGYHVYAVGGSLEAARLSGVRTPSVVISAHVLCSLCAAASGLFLVSRIGSGAPWVGPDGGYDLESIAAAVVGGTALSGGTGGVSGAMAGVLLLAVIDSLFNALEVSSFLRQLVRGVILVGAVALYAARTRRAEP